MLQWFVGWDRFAGRQNGTTVEVHVGEPGRQFVRRSLERFALEHGDADLGKEPLAQRRPIPDTSTLQPGTQALEVQEQVEPSIGRVNAHVGLLQAGSHLASQGCQDTPGVPKVALQFEPAADQAVSPAAQRCCQPAKSGDVVRRMFGFGWRSAWLRTSTRR